MKPDHRRKIAHYQTLRYPIKSDEGQDLVTFVQEPEQINQHVRKYRSPDNIIFNSTGASPVRQPYPIARRMPAANPSTELGSGSD